jgi:hypothetical protein
VFMGLALLAHWVGTGFILKLTPVGYVLSGVAAFWVLRQHPRVVAAPAGDEVRKVQG